jgi:hypothetical protein
MYKNVIVAAALMVSIFVSAPAQESGEVLFSTENNLGPGDQTVSDGSFVDYYQVRVEEGERVAIVVSSDEFDSYLYVTLPDGSQDSNDDYVDWNAGFEFIAEESGIVEFGVSSLFSGETGDYAVRVVSLPEPTELLPGERVESTLDRSGVAGRRADQYIVTGDAGERVRIELISEEFDAFLELLDSSGRRLSDDDGGDETNARLSYQFPEDGWVIITATSYDGLSAGSYELLVQSVDASDARIIDGALRPGDPRAIDGRLYDIVRVDAEPGERITAMLESDDFDAFLYLNFSTGENYDSDDDSAGESNAMIDVAAPQRDTYTLVITSYFGGEGEYTLTLYQ